MEDPLADWRHECEAKPIDELAHGIDAGLYSERKLGIARGVLEERREKRREQDEVATLKAKVADLERELRDKRTEHWWMRLGVITANTIAAAALVVAAVAAWNDGLGALFHWVVAAVKGTR